MRQNILITGASAGLGLGMAREFAALGRGLVLCARREDKLREAREELLRDFPLCRVITRRLDVNDHERVFEVFRSAQEELGPLDRVIVNAGLGKGQPIGTGYFEVNRQTAQTNFLAALAQCEAAMDLFRERGTGHLVMISSMSAMRGLPGNLTVYAATKAGVAALAEGIRAETLDTRISVSTLYPGYIRSEMNEHVQSPPLMVDTETGCRSMVAAIEREAAEACVPPWPWSPLRFFMKYLPLRWLVRMI